MCGQTRRMQALHGETEWSTSWNDGDAAAGASLSLQHNDFVLNDAVRYVRDVLKMRGFWVRYPYRLTYALENLLSQRVMREARERRPISCARIFYAFCKYISAAVDTDVALKVTIASYQHALAKENLVVHYNTRISTTSHVASLLVRWSICNEINYTVRRSWISKRILSPLKPCKETLMQQIMSHCTPVILFYRKFLMLSHILGEEIGRQNLWRFVPPTYDEIWPNIFGEFGHPLPF